MAKETAIEWADSTFNPVWGCQKVSPACDFCYAEALDKRTGGNHWGPNAPRRRTSEKNWNQPLRWQREAEAFYMEHGRKRRVFCASMADVFDNQWPEGARDDLWELIRQTPDLNWLLLTKRPQNIAKMKPVFWDEIKGHIWLGATVENQDVANRNIPHLIFHDCAVRFLSCEPLLGPIDLTDISMGDSGIIDALSGTEGVAWEGGPPAMSPTLDWIITGGESGGRLTSRPASPNWYRSLRDQCEEANIPFLFKQWGNWDEECNHHKDKKALGRVLDGVTHDGFPGAR